MRRLVTLAAISYIGTLGFAGDQSWEDRVRMAYESWTAGDRANALELWERAYHDPEKPNHPEAIAAMEFNRATALLWFGRIGEAEAGFHRALTRHESIYGHSNPGVASTLHSLALLCVRAGRPEEAKSWSRRALEIHIGRGADDGRAAARGGFGSAGSDCHLRTNRVFRLADGRHVGG